MQKNVRYWVVLVVLVAVTASAAVCPVQCLAAPVSHSSQPCHSGAGDDQPSHPARWVSCCGTVAEPAKVVAPSRSTVLFAIPLPRALGVSCAPQAGHRHSSTVRVHSPPEIYLRNHAFLI